MTNIEQILNKKLGIAIQKNVLLAPMTTFKIGGPADYFFEARTKQDLIETIRIARENKVNHFILGTGANVLISDKGFQGLVIHNQTNKVGFLDNGKVLTESGVIFADLIELCVAKGLSGLEHFVGIPSSIGGALWQNLHFLSPDRTRTVFIEEFLDNARILNERGEIKNVTKDYFNFAYDESVLRHNQDIVLEATFQLNPKPEPEMQKIISSNLKWRSIKHPPLNKFPSVGSIFRNIPGHGAGRLIDACGLKGTKIGNAKISELHANIFINLGGASAQNILDLMKLAQREVKKKFDLDLAPEIKLIGKF